MMLEGKESLRGVERNSQHLHASETEHTRAEHPSHRKTVGCISNALETYSLGICCQCERCTQNDRTPRLALVEAREHIDCLPIRTSRSVKTLGSLRFLGVQPDCFSIHNELTVAVMVDRFGILL